MSALTILLVIMMITPLTIAAIFLYYMMSRAFIVYVWSRMYGLEDMDWVLWGWDRNKGKKYRSADPVAGAIWPIAGEAWLLVTLAWVMVVMPLEYIKATGIRASEKDKIKKKELNRRDKYLDNLAEYGMRPEDVPKYIIKKEDLEEYLTIWDDHRNIVSKNKVKAL